MDEETRELDLQVAELNQEVKRLRKIESAARLVMKAFSNQLDYDAWDKALDMLEATLKEKI